MDVIHVKNISTPRFCIANIRADGEKAESARHLNRARQRNRERSRTGKGAEQSEAEEQSEAAEQRKERNRERSRTERGSGNRERSGTEEGAEQGKAAEAPHEQGRTKKSLKPDWEEAGRDSGRGLSQTI